MSWIKVEPYRRPRLSKSGLLTLMSPSGRGLACAAGACPTPGCPCRDVLMTVVPIDFRVKKVSASEDQIKFTTQPVGGLGRPRQEAAPHAGAKGLSRIDEGQMARINIEASAALEP